jgi:surface antigen
MGGRSPLTLSQSNLSRRLHASALSAALLCALAAGGCATLSPLSGVDEDGPTGSITPALDAGTPLDAYVAHADQSAILTALGAALDPQSAGQSVDWTVAGKRAGEVRPIALAKPEGDEICRAFAAEGLGASGRFEAVGVACRNKRGDWRVREMGAKKPA